MATGHIVNCFLPNLGVQNMNHSLCLISNEDRKAVLEFVEYHKPFFDKIYIYCNGKELYNIPGTIEIDAREEFGVQVAAYQHCFNHLPIGETLTCLDTDERLILEKGVSMDSLWSAFPDADVLHLSWQVMTDNNLLHNDPDKTLMEQFTEISPIDCIYNKDLPVNISECFHHKYSVKKTNKPCTMDVHTAHVLGGKAFIMTGREVNIDSPWSPPCWKIAYVRHFLTQSTSHFIEHRFNKYDCCREYRGNTI